VPYRILYIVRAPLENKDGTFERGRKGKSKNKEKWNVEMLSDLIGDPMRDIGSKQTPKVRKQFDVHCGQLRVLSEVSIVIRKNFTGLEKNSGKRWD